MLGRVYEYFLGQFAKAEGQKAGAFYTPRSVVRLLVEMLEPYKGRVYDPCCGSGGMFVQSAEFVAAHGGRRTDVSIYGQESTATTWRLGRMNLAIRGIEANLGDHAADSFHRDLHPDLRADFILANPPFNLDDWYSEALRDDPRWKYGLPPAGNANFAWVQHFVHHLAPTGMAGFVLANGCLSSKTQRRGRDPAAGWSRPTWSTASSRCPRSCSSTPASPSACGSLPRTAHDDGFREREARCCSSTPESSGRMENRTLRVLDDVDVCAVAEHLPRLAGRATADALRGRTRLLSLGADLDEIAAHDFVLTPGRYVGRC